MARILFLFLMVFTPYSLADWQVNGQGSSVNFVSVKNGLVVEAHFFKSISGEANKDSIEFSFSK